MKNGSYIPAFNYDLLTPFYDFFLNILGFGYKERVKIVELLELKPSENLLDIGCGSGSLVIVAKKLHPENHITGSDIDEKILKIAEKKIKKENLGIKLIKTSAAKLPFNDSSFDVIVSSLVFHHLSLETKRLAITEIKRVLKKEGRFLLVDFGKANRLWMKLLYLLEKLLGIKEAKTL